jgi:hypothetical protein
MSHGQTLRRHADHVGVRVHGLRHDTFRFGRRPHLTGGPVEVFRSAVIRLLSRLRRDAMTVGGGVGVQVDGGSDGVESGMASAQPRGPRSLSPVKFDAQHADGGAASGRVAAYPTAKQFPGRRAVARPCSGRCGRRRASPGRRRRAGCPSGRRTCVLRRGGGHDLPSPHGVAVAPDDGPAGRTAPGDGVLRPRREPPVSTSPAPRTPATTWHWPGASTGPTRPRMDSSLLAREGDARQKTGVEAWAVWGLSDVGVARGDWEVATGSAEESLELFQRLNDPFGIGWSLFMSASSNGPLQSGDRGRPAAARASTGRLRRHGQTPCRIAEPPRGTCSGPRMPGDSDRKPPRRRMRTAAMTTRDVGDVLT